MNLNTSYNHHQFKYRYTYLEDNLWIYNTQYFRFFLQSQTIRFPSPYTFIPIQNYAGSSHKYVFKAKYAAGLIGKYVYYSLKYIKFCSHFMKFSKRFVQMKQIKKQIKIIKRVDYKTKELIFSKVYKHILLFYRDKYRKRIKKYRKILWNQFYQVPSVFWTNRIKKKIKSFIWKILNLRTFVKNKNNDYNRKVIRWKYRFFFLNYDRISSLLYRWIIKKRLPYNWIDYLMYSIKKKRKNVYNNNITGSYSSNFNIKSIFHSKKPFSIENNLVGNERIKYIKSNINLLYNDIYVILYTLCSYSKEIYLDYYKQIINSIISNNNKFFFFFTNYCLFLFFRSINKKKRLIRDNYYLKWFYKSLSAVSKHKEINKNQLYINTGIITDIYKFSNISFTSIFLKINGWFEKYNIDRDLYYYFVLNRLFIFKTKLISTNIINLVLNNTFNNNLFFTFTNIHMKHEQNENNEIKNKSKKKKYDFYKKFITEKETSWIRLCFNPKIWNYRYLLQNDKEIPISHQIIEEKEKLSLLHYFYSTINKTQVSMNNFIKHNHSKNKNVILDGIFNKKIKTSYQINSKLIYNKMKKPEIFIKRMESRLKSNNEIKIVPNIKFSNTDQSILNQSVNIFFKKKKLNKDWSSFSIKKLFFLRNRMKKKNNDKVVIDIEQIKNNNKKILTKKNNLFYRKNYMYTGSYLQKRKYTLTSYNNKKYYNYNRNTFFIWKKYNMNYYVNKYINNKTNIYLNDLKVLKNKLMEKNYNEWKKKSILKYINFNIRSSTYSYNYLEKKKNNNYLISLWILRKQNRLFLESRLDNKLVNHFIYRPIYQFRFFEKKGFVNTYSFYSNIYKELFLEYARRLHSKNKLDEFERNFEKIGPLSFYYNRSINISNIKNGLYISSNFLVLSPFFKNFYSKPFFGTTQWVTKIFTTHLFLPFELLYNNLDQNQYQYDKNIFKKNIKKFNFSNYFYKKWMIQI
jgi:hypothetical protein